MNPQLPNHSDALPIPGIDTVFQEIVTVALVVLPILAIGFILPMLMNSLGAAYGVSADPSSLLQGLK
jgi:hypothetical protein